MQKQIKNILDFSNKPNFVTILWFLVPIIAVILLISGGDSEINNYLIFKNVFWHTVHQQNLYSVYPEAYFDKNHYGPLFSILIAPFAVLPNFIGATLWTMLNIWILFYAVHKLPISNWGKNIILLICLIEMLTSVQNLQFNPMLCSWIILTYVFIKEGKLGLAAMLIVAGTFVKLYGIVGIPFIFFTKDYKKIFGYLVLWAILFFCLPMFISSPEFVIQSYFDWYRSLVEKNMENVTSYQSSGMTDISAMGFVKRISGFYNLPTLYFTIPAGILMLLPICRYSKWNLVKFQLTYLAQLLIGLVIFSTSAESPTYVIAVIGFGIWYALSAPKPKKWMYVLLLFVLILTVFSPTDLFPKFLRDQYVVKYSLKAVPCFLSWLIISIQLIFAKFDQNSSDENRS
ncbi:MAG: glycosyltransferase family 87 protein [Bacteroidetes bacterium]|nr:glycosyltransferase family 87 protein [Bacteroidota bacterium]